MKTQLAKFYDSRKSASSIPSQKYETVLNRNFKKSKMGFGSSNSRFFKRRSSNAPGPGSYYR